MRPHTTMSIRSSEYWVLHRMRHISMDSSVIKNPSKENYADFNLFTCRWLIKPRFPPPPGETEDERSWRHITAPEKPSILPELSCFPYSRTGKDSGCPMGDQVDEDIKNERVTPPYYVVEISWQEVMPPDSRGGSSGSHS